MDICTLCGRDICRGDVAVPFGEVWLCIECYQELKPMKVESTVVCALCCRDILRGDVAVQLEGSYGDRLCIGCYEELKPTKVH